MILKVNPNRMELMKLKKRLLLARKGHKLLKDKQEQLIRIFFQIVRENKALRKSVEDALIEAYQSFLVAKSFMGEEKVEEAILMPTVKIKIDYGKTQIVEGDILSYSTIETSTYLDDSVIKFREVLEKMLVLAEKEKAIIELANEIINTRRRVNALEYILIPNLIETIKYIRDKLNEMERSNIARLMKIKDMVMKG